MWGESKKLGVINYYNTSNRLELNKLKEVEGQSRNNVIWCGDFNAHTTCCGGVRGWIVMAKELEEMLDEDLVCLNDGSLIKDSHVSQQTIGLLL